MSAPDKPFVVRMPEALHARLKAAAAADDRSMAQAIRFAIRKYVERIEAERMSPDPLETTEDE